MTARLLRLLGVRFVPQRVENVRDFEHATRIFDEGMDGGKSPFRVVIVSAHGSPRGIGLTDGTMLNWAEFFSPFGEKLRSTTVVFSSCSVLKDRVLRTHIETAEDVPEHVIGYRQPVDWADSAVATALLIRAMRRARTFADYHNVLVTIHDVLGLDIEGLLKQNGVVGGARGAALLFEHTDTCSEIAGVRVPRMSLSAMQPFHDRARELRAQGASEQQIHAEMCEVVARYRAENAVPSGGGVAP